MSQIKSGKRPLSQKSTPAPIRADEVFADPLVVDPEMAKVIRSKGYVFALINYKHYVDMGGVHPMHWQAISKKQLKDWGYATIDAQSFLIGQDTDGYIRRGDLILAVRPQSIHDKHRAYIDQENARASNLQKSHAEQLRELNRSNGSRDAVFEGYDDDENEQ